MHNSVHNSWNKEILEISHFAISVYLFCQSDLYFDPFQHKLTTGSLMIKIRYSFICDKYKVNQFYVQADFMSPEMATVTPTSGISAAFSKQQVIISVR